MTTPSARTLARSTLLVLWLLLPAATPAFASQPAEVQPTPAERLQRAEWSLVRPTPVITLHIRRVVGYVMLVPAGTLFMLYLFRPRPYVLAGAFAWAAGSVMLLVLAYDSGEELRSAAAEVAKSRDEMKAMAVTDPLTRCYNRRLLYEIAEHELEQIRQAFLESAIVTNLPDGVDVSIGCVPVPPDTRDFDPLIDRADREMYRRKRVLAS